MSTRETKVLSCEGLPAGAMMIVTPARNGWMQVVRPGQPVLWVRREPGVPTITWIATPGGLEMTLAFRDRFETATTKPEDA